MSAPDEAVTKAPPPPRPARGDWRVSRRNLRRTLYWGGLLGLLALVALIIVVIATVGFNRPPSWIVDVREYRIASRLALIMTVLIFVVAAMTWLLGIVSAVLGAVALGGGAGTVRQRLRIARRRLRLTVVTTIVMRLALLAVLAIAAAYAYTRFLGPPLASGLPYTVEQLFGTNLLAVILVIPIVIAWIIGPVLRVRQSAALGALAATYTKGRPERVAYALGARFAVGLASVLGVLWLWSGGLLILLTVVDPVSYQSSVPFPSQLALFGLPLLLIPVSVGTVVYPIAQLLMAEGLTRLATGRMRRGQRQEPHGK